MGTYNVRFVGGSLWGDKVYGRIEVIGELLPKMGTAIKAFTKAGIDYNTGMIKCDCGCNGQFPGKDADSLLDGNPGISDYVKNVIIEYFAHKLDVDNQEASHQLWAANLKLSNDDENEKVVGAGSDDLGSDGHFYRAFGSKYAKGKPAELVGFMKEKLKKPGMGSLDIIDFATDEQMELFDNLEYAGKISNPNRTIEPILVAPNSWDTVYGAAAKKTVGLFGVLAKTKDTEYQLYLFARELADLATGTIDAELNNIGNLETTSGKTKINYLPVLWGVVSSDPDLQGTVQTLSENYSRRMGFSAANGDHGTFYLTDPASSENYVELEVEVMEDDMAEATAKKFKPNSLLDLVNMKKFTPPDLGKIKFNSTI